MSPGLHAYSHASSPCFSSEAGHQTLVQNWVGLYLSIAEHGHSYLITEEANCCASMRASCRVCQTRSILTKNIIYQDLPVKRHVAIIRKMWPRQNKGYCKLTVFRRPSFPWTKEKHSLSMFFVKTTSSICILMIELRILLITASWQHLIRHLYLRQCSFGFARNCLC